MRNTCLSQVSVAFVMLLLLFGIGACGKTDDHAPPSTTAVSEFPIVDPGQPSNPMFLAVGPDRNIGLPNLIRKVSA